MNIRYVGPHAEVVIAPTGQTVRRGEAVEVTASVARALLMQASWEKATKKKETRDG